MLRELTLEQAQRVAALAKTAREARDAFIDNVPEAELGAPPPARGEHNPTADLGFGPLSPDAPPLRGLQNAINALSPAARSELSALVRIGQTELAAGNWDSVLAETLALGDQTVAGSLLDDPDLHDHIAKGLYELKAS